MSNIDNLSLLLVMVIAFILPVDISLAVTVRMPFSSIEKHTSQGLPRGPGIQGSVNEPSRLLSVARGLSPS